MSDQAPPVRRPMKFPYTYTAKIAQFPYAYYFKNNFIYKYYTFALVLSLPVFYKIHKMANSPENLAKYAEMRKREALEHAHH